MSKKKTKKKLLSIYEELVIENEEQQNFLEDLRIELEYKDMYIRTIEEENLRLKARICELEVAARMQR